MNQWAWVLTQAGPILYIVLFSLLLAGAIGIPIPEDIPLFLAGILINQGKVQPILTFIVCYAAVLLGDILIFYVGYRFGSSLLTRPWLSKKLSPERVSAIRSVLERRGHGLITIFIARHLFYLRTATFITCGMVKMRFSLFLIADGLAALVSVPLVIALGYCASEHYDTVIQLISKFRTGSILVGVFLATLLFIHFRRRASQRETEVR